MSLISEIKEIKRAHVFNTALTFMSSIGPGFLILYKFKHSEFIQFDVLKLSILSAALTLPLIITNLIVISNLLKNPDVQKDKTLMLALAAFFTSMVFYFALTWSHIKSLTFIQFASKVCIFELFFIVFTFIGGIGNAKKTIKQAHDSMLK